MAEITIALNKYGDAPGRDTSAYDGQNVISMHTTMLNGHWPATRLAPVTNVASFIPGHYSFTDFELPASISLKNTWTYYDGIWPYDPPVAQSSTETTSTFAIKFWRGGEVYWLCHEVIGIEGDTSLEEDFSPSISLNDGDKPWNVALYIPTYYFGPGESTLWGDNYQNARVSLTADTSLKLFFANEIPDSSLEDVEGPMGPPGPTGPPGPPGEMGSWPYDGYNTLLDKLTYLERKVDGLTREEVDHGTILDQPATPDTTDGGAPDTASFDGTVDGSGW
jgi:hypothetical protein